MSDDIDDVVREMIDYVDAHAPTDIDVPDTVTDEEAVHAVQRQYDQAGFECDEETAREIVSDART